ncbi:nucleotide-diphospho-sugar transferase [Plectosphaerella plurivora]|uniref:Nucleotide-diphospho-sugar transferase n=1 Tax=Plectosphaerella plurivora TaxID=936078 RepID=A0A9P8VKI1_9PEZI|nr:nucleotide-diphospho-sugar transferase [Plectosphaerella plurivora]
MTQAALIGFTSLTLFGPVLAAPMSIVAPLRTRAALICLTSDDETAPTVSTITDLESRFNWVYKYDWTIFSREELSTETKDALSNATSGGAMTFDLVPDDLWLLPESNEGCKDQHDDDFHRKTRWQAGLFALESRLRSFDWYLKVDPGSQFSHDFKFDVFAAMRDTQTCYGANGIGQVSSESARALRETAKSFMARHQQTIMREADFTWILGPSDTADYADGHNPDHDLDYLSELGFNEHKPQVEAPDARPSRDMPVNTSAADCTEIHNCQLDARFDMGSLQMLRGAEFRAFFDHLDDEGTFLYHHIPATNVKSLGASLLFPQSNVWRMDDVSCTTAGHAYCLPSDNSASMIKRHRRRFLAAMIGGPAQGWTDAMVENNGAGLVLWGQYWNNVAKDLGYLQFLKDSGFGHTNLDWGQIEHKKRWIFGPSESAVPVGEMIVRYFIEGDVSQVCKPLILQEQELEAEAEEPAVREE